MRRGFLISIALVAFVVAACDPNPAPPGPAPLRYRDEVFSSFDKTTDVSYGSAVDQHGVTVDLKLDVYQPMGDTVTSRPLAIWIHGGNFVAGNKNSPEIVDEAETFAKKGYVTASIDYRLAPSGCLPPGVECIIGIEQARQDAQTAVRFFRENALTYGIDPTRIAIGGSSAGAITALNVGYTGETSGPGDHQGFSSAVGAAQSISGAQIGSGRIDPGDAPALLFHGTADPIVPYSWAQSTVARAKAQGLVALLIAWTGDGHVPYVQHRSQILDQTRNFFYSHLDLAHAA